MGVLAMSVFSTFRGKELEDDPEFQKRMQEENVDKNTVDFSFQKFTGRMKQHE